MVLPRRRLPWSGGSPREIAVFVAALACALYVVLTPLHLLVLSGRPRVVMASVAAASAVAAAVAGVAIHRRLVPAHRLPVVLTAVAALPLVNALTHTAVAHQLEQ